MLPTAPVLMLRGTRWSVNDPYNPANDVHFFGRRVTIGERNLDPSSIATHEAKTALSVWDAVRPPSPAFPCVVVASCTLTKQPTLVVRCATSR